MELRYGAALGDELVATSIVREFKRARPDENVRIWRPARPEIWENNPHLNRGRKDNGKRVLMLASTAGRISHYYAGNVAAATGVLLKMENDAPEVFLTDEERGADFGFTIHPRSVAIDPWAGWGTRRWPHENFCRLAKLLARRGWQVIELGAGTRRPGPLPMARDLYGKTGIRETAAILSRVSLYVGNDSGLMHLAAAVGTPQVIPFGVVPSSLRAYPSTRGIDPVMACDPRCAGAILDCARRRGRQGCMESITVDRVLQEIDR